MFEEGRVINTHFPQQPHGQIHTELGGEGVVCSARPPDRLLEWPLVILDVRLVCPGFCCVVTLAMALPGPHGAGRGVVLAK